jgi:hypothetical protein
MLLTSPAEPESNRNLAFGAPPERAIDPAAPNLARLWDRLAHPRGFGRTSQRLCARRARRFQSDPLER